MSDSNISCTTLSISSQKVKSSANLMYKIKRESDNSGEVLNGYATYFGAQSPLTGAGFKVKAIFSGNGKNLGDVNAYLVSINPPACTIGNNVLLDNVVYSCAKIDLLMLQYVLLSGGTNPEVVKGITLDNTKFESVTLTFLFRCSDHADAVRAKSEMFQRGEILKNGKYSSSSYKPVRQVGASGDSTIYLDHADFQIVAYVKSGPTKKSFESFPDENVAEQIYAEGSRLLRIEVRFKRAWLIANKMDTPEAWRLTDGNKPYEIGLALIRKYLRLDENLRTRRPQPSHTKVLCPTDREILEWHLSGRDARMHPRIKSKGNQHNQHVYFSAVKLRVLAALRIDLAIPWEDQRGKLSSRLGSLLVFDNRYRIPRELRQHSFCLKTVTIAIKKLTRMVKRLPMPG